MTDTERDGLSAGLTLRVVDAAFVVLLGVALAAGVETGAPPVGLAALVAASVALEAVGSHLVTERVLESLDHDGDAPAAVEAAVGDLSRHLGVAPADVVVDGDGDPGVSVLGDSDDAVLLVSGPVVEYLDDRALRGVVAHELAHVALGHLRRVPFRGAVTHVVGAVALWVAVGQGLPTESAVLVTVLYLAAAATRYGGLSGTMYLAGSFGVVLVPLALGAYASRLEEYAADDVAVAHTSPTAFCTGLYRITAADGSAGLDGVGGGRIPTGDRPFHDRLLAEYPSVESRLARQGVDPADVAADADAEATVDPRSGPLGSD